ncbi:uncharacterized protein LOC124310309 [Neodiprion virginianus]|uniref:uncharacterized protein LOC124310309 n=1 Tax=Neodiprion virginianus TaxID=2961670 RepID=UPI001EE6CFBB|nr:uncharacterized protein LOC124310309 [Neodiprion virginianus]
MACHDEDTALRLNIKVNSENLLPTPQKYNLGSLRLPADPSWPKIPQRRLADDAGDLIQPLYTVTFTGTPRRSRTIEQVPRSQSSKMFGTQDSRKEQYSQSQQPRRRSGCPDPRFKKVTTVRSQMTSTDLGEVRTEEESGMSVSKDCKSIADKTVPWIDSTQARVMQQKAEKPDESKGMESVGVQTVQIVSSEVALDSTQLVRTIKESNEQSSGYAESRRKSCSPVKSGPTHSERDTPRPSTSVGKTTPRNSERIDLKSSEFDQTHPLQCCQAKDGQLFLTVEKKVQATNMPITNKVDLVPGKKSQSTTQCYNVQVPVLSFQNLPVQMSTQLQSKVDIPPHNSSSSSPDSQISTLFKNINIPKLELPNDVTPQFMSLGTSFSKITSNPFSSQTLESHDFQLNTEPTSQSVIGSKKKLDDLKQQQHLQFHKDKQRQLTTESNFPLSFQTNRDRDFEFKSNSEKLMKNIRNEEKCSRPQQNILNFNKDNVIPKHDFHIYCHPEQPLQSHTTDAQQKLCNIQAPQYQLVTTDSEPERYGAFNKQNRNPDNGTECLVKNKTYFQPQQQPTDTDSHVSDKVTQFCKMQKNYCQPAERLNASFLDGIEDHQNKKFESLKQKNVYFEKNKPQVLNQDWKHQTLQLCDQGKVISLRQKRKMKSEQRLMLNKKRIQSSEPHISTNRRRTQTPYLKKASSCLSECTQQLTPDPQSNCMYQTQQRIPVSNQRENVNNMTSDDTENFPSSQHTMQADNINFIDCNEINARVPHPTDFNGIKPEHCIKPYQRPPNKDAKITSSLDLEKQNLSSLQSPRADTDVPTEKPTAIPVKTQQLLNKSYWDYYNKLKLHKMVSGESPQQQYFCQVAMGAPISKKRRAPESIAEESNNTSQVGDQMELSLPEIRTLEQCSVLSTMINKTLDSALQPLSETLQTKQIYLNGNMRSSSDPTAGTQSAILKKLLSGENEDSIISSTLMYTQKHKHDKDFSNKTSKLKSIGEHPIVFFGCMVYAMIIFLPMIYDCFFYEEHDQYEDLSYIEVVFEYIISSVKEACGVFFDMMNKIFLKPDARMQRLSSGRWKQKISKQHLF